jgi:hypothetical protein
MKLMVSITQANTEPWLSIWREGQQKTWMKKDKKIVTILNYKSKAPPKFLAKFDIYHERYRYHQKIGKYVSIFDKIFAQITSKEIPAYKYIESENLLAVDSYSMYLLTNKRNLSLFKFFIEETECNFLFQTNTSSYVDCTKLLRVIENFDPKSNVYAGFVVEPQSTRAFVSGAGRLLSRAAIELIYSQYKQFPHDNLEDVSIGDFMRKFGVEPLHLNRLDLPNLEILNNISDEELGSNFVFRCKSDEVPRKDAIIMQKLHARINGNLR